MHRKYPHLLKHIGSAALFVCGSYHSRDASRPLLASYSPVAPQRDEQLISPWWWWWLSLSVCWDREVYAEPSVVPGRTPKL